MTYETKCVQVCISKLFVKTKKLHEKAIVSNPYLLDKLETLPRPLVLGHPSWSA